MRKLQTKRSTTRLSRYLILVGFLLTLFGFLQTIKSITLSDAVAKPTSALVMSVSISANEFDTQDSIKPELPQATAEEPQLTQTTANKVNPTVEELESTQTTVFNVTPTIEDWPRKDAFYISSYTDNDTSTTIIFNVYKGSPKALELQLEAAINQRNVAPPQIWVMCFNSPHREEFYNIVMTFKSLPRVLNAGINIVWTTSDYNHKFHGRFLMAYMATTKYVLLVDDDRNLDETTVADYISYMRRQPGIWGNFGHIRATNFQSYKSWPNVGFPMQNNVPVDDYTEVDYLSGMWFLQQTWLEYFMKERPPTWETSEDMHLSHVMRKYLNLNTYGGKVALRTKDLPGKNYAATVGSALDLREHIFDHQLGRGNKVANVEQPIETLVYVETVDDINQFIVFIDSCKAQTSPQPQNLRSRTEKDDKSSWCDFGRTAAVFRGAKEQDVEGMIEAAIRLCTRTKCKYLSVKPKIQHYIQYFNMREGFGQQDTNVEIPWQTAASDVLQSFVGVLNNIQPHNVFVSSPTHRQWNEEQHTSTMPQISKQSRLSIYYRTIVLGLHVYFTSPTNPKWMHREEVAIPTTSQAYQWSYISTVSEKTTFKVDRIEIDVL